MSAAHDVSLYVASLGLGTVYVGAEPANHAATLLTTIYDTGGTPTENWAGYQDLTLQVRATASSYVAGYDRCADIRDALIAPTNADFGDWRYTGFWLISDVAHIGRDDRNRNIFTVNFRLMREPLGS